MAVDLSGYIDVAERIVEFRTKHPEGSLQPADPVVPFRIEDIGGTTWIVVVAAAYRSPDDQRPGIGMAYEPFPGRTPYTKGSELQNAETSAWGRAIVAALAADTSRGVASQQEVRNRRAEQAEPAPADAARSELLAVLRDKGVAPKDATARFAADGHGDLAKATDVDAIRALIDHYKAASDG